MSNVVYLPVVAGVEITTDEYGRFNLNALHRASGLGSTKRPSIWLASKQTQELIAALESLSQNSGLDQKSPDAEIPASAVAMGQSDLRSGVDQHDWVAESCLESELQIGTRFRF